MVCVSCSYPGQRSVVALQHCVPEAEVTSKLVQELFEDEIGIQLALAARWKL